MTPAARTVSGAGAGSVLILGGTGEARALAAALVELSAPSAAAAPRVISSLAGRVARPRLPVGEVRIGGFGGPERLAEWLRAQSISCVVDATHPFAERISASAAQAAEAASIPILRLQRPGWSERPGDQWQWVDGLDEAAAALPDGARVLLTTGRQGLAAFADISHAWFLVRCVDPPETPLPPNHELLLDRGPYTLEGELALLNDHAISIVATKDSGGQLTVAKLDAARARSLPVIVVRRPAGPPIPTVDSVEAATAWAQTQLAL